LNLKHLKAWKFSEALQGMDFKQLMKLASQNKSHARKQQDRNNVATKSCDGKSKDSGISQAAVQAFLAKKEMEKKKKLRKKLQNVQGFRNAWLNPLALKMQSLRRAQKVFQYLMRDSASHQRQP